MTTNAQAIALARSLMDAHGLDEWNIRINTNKTRLGVCKYGSKTIEISSFFFRAGDETLRDTILHEIAHALAGHAAGHGDAWQAVCIRIGADPSRTADVRLTDSDFAWVGKCSCGKTKKRNHRRPQNLNGWFCKVCRDFLTWTHNGVPVGGSKADQWAVAAKKIATHREAKVANAPLPYDRGFTDIESLWAD